VAIDYRLNFTLHANQMLVHANKARFRWVKAGKRFGKSMLACLELVQWAGMHPGGEFWYVAPTYGQAEGIAWKHFNNIIPPHLIKSTRKDKLTIELNQGAGRGATIILKGAENETTLRGIDIAGIIVDEAAYIKEHIWPNILRGQLAGSLGKAMLISSPLNREQKRTMVDWFPRAWEEAKKKMDSGDKNEAAFYFNIYDNPILPIPEIDDIKARCTDDAWNLEYMAIEDVLAGALISEFNFDKHVGELKDAKPTHFCRGIDWGMDHPTVCLWGSFDNTRLLDPVTNPVYIHDEFVKSGMVIRDSSGVIKQMTGSRGIDWTVIDPSTRKRNSQTMRSDADEFARYGITCIPGDNRSTGYDVMKMFFKYDLIKIHPKCRNLINQVRDLQYGQKTNDDCTDALRYMLMRIHAINYMGNTFENAEKRRVSGDVCLCEFPNAKCPMHRQEITFNELKELSRSQRPSSNSNSWIAEEVL
jgi:hypothetical protein